MLSCSVCHRTESIVWAHNGGFDTHRWDDTDDERDCTCSPKPICTACDCPLLQTQGFVVLDADCFAPQHMTLQKEDKVPLKSKAQQRFLFAAQARGEIPKGTAEKFVKETPKRTLARLPEYKAKDEKVMRKYAKAKKSKG